MPTPAAETSYIFRCFCNPLAAMIMGIFLMFGCNDGLGQVNDNWSGALTINVSATGFGLGSFNGATSSLAAAGTETGEYLSSPVFQRTVWYKFTIATTRLVNIGVALSGPDAGTTNVGFFIYKQAGGIPGSGNLGVFTDGAAGATSENSCLPSGTYFIQICSAIDVNVSVQPQLIIETTPNAAAHDLVSNAIDMGVIGAQNGVTLDWGCASMQNAFEYFPAIGASYLSYNKSLWVRFQTDNHVDLLSYSLNGFSGSNGGDLFAIRIFEEPVITANLDTASALYSSFRPFHGGGAYTHLVCEIQPSSSYLVQIVGRADYLNTSSFSIRHLGEGPIQELYPTEALWSATNDFGTIVPTLSPGTTVSRSDNFSCGSRLSLSPASCTNVNPLAGYSAPNGLSYDLTNWFTFNLSEESSVIISSSVFCQYCNSNVPNHSMYVRVFSQLPNNNCSSFNLASDIIFETTFNPQGFCYFTCLPPGEYSIQVLGRSQLSGDPYNCQASQFGRRHNLSLTFIKPALFEYGLSVAADVDRINAGNPIEVNNLHVADLAELTCNKTVLPDNTICQPTLDRAVYRTFEIGDGDGDLIPDSGIVALRNYTYTNNGLGVLGNSVLYRGDIDAMAQSQNAFDWPSEITGLEPLMGCNLYNNYWYWSAWCNQPFNVQKYCLTPGTYTIAQFGDSTDVGAVLQPSVQLKKTTTQFWNPAFPDDMGDIIAQNLVVQSQPDKFSCRDNPEVIDGYVPCSDRTKLIYREFYLSQECEITVQEQGSLPFPFRLFNGRVSQVGIAGLTLATTPQESCLSSFQRVECQTFPQGWYTVVSYGFGPNYDNNLGFHETYQNGNYTSCDIMNSAIYDIDLTTRITITVDTTPSPGPFYYYPSLACELPGPATYVNVATSDNPSPYTEYPLCAEYFKSRTEPRLSDGTFQNCVGSDKVAFYVFTTDDEYYVRIRNINAFRKLLYNLDVRTADSLLLGTTSPVVTCSVGFNDVEVCRLPPGTYTLMVLASPAQVCVPCSPILDVSPVAYSRFDHASATYDFGIIPADNTMHYGKIGDAHPTNPALSPSTDSFYCTTGANQSDPWFDCINNNLGEVYPDTVNSIYYQDPSEWESELIRRNLWYSFAVRGKGNATVEVRSLNGPGYGYSFAIFSSDVEGWMNFSDVQTSGFLDSTSTTGLALIADNTPYNWNCDKSSQSGFTINGNPCLEDTVTRRYYVLVERHHPFDYGGNFDALNGQIDVGIRWSPIETPDYPGDECELASAATGAASGVYNVQTPVNCQTMQDPYWDLPENLACLAGPNGYKSTWFKFSYEGDDVVDVGFQPLITGLSNYGLPSAINYRLFYGRTCSTMIAGQECAESSFISNTIACVDSSTGHFYVEVVYPSSATGQIGFSFTVSANTNPNCIPFNPTVVDAFFIYSQICSLDTLEFLNYSSVGPQMEYQWDFGFPGGISDEKDPRVVFPENGLYYVNLTSTNDFANTNDSYGIWVQVLDTTDRMNLVPDTMVCFGDVVTFGRPLYQATYSWSSGSTQSQIQVNSPGQYWVNYSVIGCPFTDTVNVEVYEFVPVIEDTIRLCSNTDETITYVGFDSLSWQVPASNIDEIGTLEYVIRPAGGTSHPWLAYHRGCDATGTVFVEELYPIVPADPQWDSIRCYNEVGITLPVMANTIGMFEYNGIPVVQLEDLALNAGSYALDYVYTDQQNCPDTVDLPFAIVDTTVISWSNQMPSLCADLVEFNLMDLVEDTTGQFFVSYDSGDLPSIASNKYYPPNAAGNSEFPRDFLLRYELVDGNTCLSTSFGTVQLKPDPIFDIDIPELCQNTDMIATNSSYVNDGYLTDFIWVFENYGQFDTYDLQSFLLNQAGTFNLTTLARSNHQCDAELNFSIEVFPAPQVNLVYDGNCQYEPIAFDLDIALASGSVQSQEVVVNQSQFYSAVPFVQDFNDSGLQQFSVEVISDRGCVTAGDEQVMIYPEPVQQIVADSGCFGDEVTVFNEGTIPQGSIEIMRWYLDGAYYAGNEQADAITLMLTDLNEIVVGVELISEAGCFSYAEAVVGTYPLPIISIVPEDRTICSGQEVAYGCDVSVGSNESIASIQWVFSNGFESFMQSGTLELTNAGVIDALITAASSHGCESTFFSNDFIQVKPNPVADFNVNKSSFDFVDNDLLVINSSSPNVVKWEYSMSDGFETAARSFRHKLERIGEYQIELNVTDDNGCRDSTVKTVELLSDLIVHIPNAFTPNSDGDNDYFIPVISGEQLTFYHMVIFDRWGIKVFDSYNRDEPWIGDVKESDFYGISDAYTYKLDITSISGIIRAFDGVVFLVR